MKRIGLRRTLLWVPPIALLALTLALVLLERELQGRIDGALATEREHVGRARSAQEAAQQTYVALLERWIRPPGERMERSKEVARDLDHLRAAATSFAVLEPLSQTEAEARAKLVVALALFSNRVQRALINDDGPAAIAEIEEYTQAIHDATQQVLTIDSAAGQTNDTQMLALRKKSSLAMAGLVVMGAGATASAILWWRLKRRADRRYEAAESARREQEQATRVRAKFYAHLSHELRTPIVVIQNLTAQLHETVVAKRIRQAADELLHGINNVLDSSKLEAGQQQMKLEAVDVGQVIRRSVHRCEGLVGTKDIFIAVELDEHLPPIVADVVKLYQVVTNLVANAIKFTERGTVTVRATRSDEASIRIEVEDTGIGISREALERIWQPFEQADETISSRFGGTGLGLSLVRSLVTLHDGEVGVRSEPGEGTCFWVTLPVSRKAAAA